MAGEMSIQPLGTVARVRSGFAFKSEDMSAVGFPIVKIKNIVPPSVDVSDCDRVPAEVISSIPDVERYELKEGDTLIAMTGATVGKVGRFPRARERHFLNQRVGKVYLTKPNAADYQFIYYVLSQDAYVRQIFGRADGSAQANVSGFQIEKIEIPLPPLPQQRAVAHILGTLDDKIELNRRMSETLEAMARALFMSWFVDFDPVRAKAEGRDTGLPQHLADLFPARLVDSELGEIPEGWVVGTLADVAKQLRDNENPMQSPDIVFEHFSIPAYDEGQWPKHEVGENIKSLKSRVPAGVVLLSKLNPEIERVWLVDVRPGDRAICSTEFLVLAPRRPHGRSYLYCLARSPLFRKDLKGLVTGTSKSHQRAQANSILGLGVITVPSALLDQFERAAERLLSRILECRRESRTLAALRDTLLPQLISGELRVKDAERFIERAV